MESEKSDTQRKINSSSSEFLTESETDYLRKKIEECREYVLKWLQENPDKFKGLKPNKWVSNTVRVLNRDFKYFMQTYNSFYVRIQKYRRKFFMPKKEYFESILSLEAGIACA